METHKGDTDQQFEIIFRRNDEMQTHINSVEKSNGDFRQMQCETYVQQKISDIVPNLTEEDIQPDTETYSIEIDPATNPKASEARMMSIHQV